VTTVVLDASAAVRLVVGPAPTDIAEMLADADDVCAPALFEAEVANVLWKYVGAGAFAVDDALGRLTTALRLCDRFIEVGGIPLAGSLLSESFAESCRLKHPLYDLLYLVAARRLTATLATCDARLGSLAARQGVSVIGVVGRRN
jgi:predicted nucleic acid-binding protein